MKKEYTQTDYEKYMKIVDDYIKKAEMAINELPKLKEVRNLTFEDWVKFQNGELK
jgi:predicted AAA+ superfamily ATPase